MRDSHACTDTLATRIILRAFHGALNSVPVVPEAREGELIRVTTWTPQWPVQKMLGLIDTTQAIRGSRSLTEWAYRYSQVTGTTEQE